MLYCPVSYYTNYIIASKSLSNRLPTPTARAAACAARINA